MHRASVRHLPVVNRDGMLVGVVTDRDVRHHLFVPGVFEPLGQTSVEAVLKAALVAEIMSRSVISVPPEANLSDAAQLLRTERIGSLPVVDGGRVVGIVTETDLLRRICQADAGCSPECTEIIVSYP
jgi:acetoin utilization protein AcuB